jgi:TolB-like protein
MANERMMRFSNYELDLDAAELRCGGQTVAVEPQVFDLIRFFADNPGRLVTRDDIIEGVWGGRIVSDAAISTRIAAARKALGDDGKAQRVIKTVSRRGFRFLPEARRDEPSRSTPTKRVEFELEHGLLPLPDRPSIAIVPFEGLSADADTHSFAQGLRIDIQNALIKVSGLFLIAVGSANAVAGLPSKEAAATLGVRYLLQGQVRRGGTMIRVSVQLIDALADRIVWAEQYDRPIENTFRFLDEVTRQVLAALNVRLVAGESATVWHKSLEDLKSLEVFYRGVSHFFHMNQEGLARARRDFENIAGRYPHLSLGPTWVSLTHWYDLQRGFSTSPRESHDLARQWAEKAVTMAGADGQACTVLSHVYLLDRNFDAALEAGAAAVRNRPSCTHANGFYANVLHFCGCQDAALKHIRLALRHSPIHPPLFKLILALILRATGALDGAAAAASEALRSNRDDIAAHALAAAIAAKQGRVDLAAVHVGEVCQQEPAFSVNAFSERQPYRDERLLADLAADLRTAGLPD